MATAEIGGHRAINMPPIIHVGGIWEQGGKDMTTPTPIRILTVDDHPLLLEGLATVIESQPDIVRWGKPAIAGTQSSSSGNSAPMLH